MGGDSLGSPTTITEQGGIELIWLSAQEIKGFDALFVLTRVCFCSTSCSFIGLITTLSHWGAGRGQQWIVAYRWRGTNIGGIFPVSWKRWSG